jgi:hypothetical protein
LVKLEYSDGNIVRPLNRGGLLFGEYLAVEDTPLDNGIEFKIPGDFAGRLNFVFYQSELKNLKITAWYR